MIFQCCHFSLLAASTSGSRHIVQSAELQITAHRVKCGFLLRKMDPQKLESDLIIRSLGELILEAIVSLTMVFSVQVCLVLLSLCT